ncbi:unnamed protein product [Protopolystoma xenopodis]|uniref:Uncharacterized protein n=1 Tax=Protopolystoma xenopodis TaxID=117903 RepID=A0A3S5FBY6_9PLAT|nr:unnamed protein product [Protopolystoma xenopodis]
MAFFLRLNRLSGNSLLQFIFNDCPVLRSSLSNSLAKRARLITTVKSSTAGIHASTNFVPEASEQTAPFCLNNLKPDSKSLSVGDSLPAPGLASTRIRFHVPRKPLRLRGSEGVGGGPEGRLSQLRRCVSALVREERLELPWKVACETRQYAERLMQLVVIASHESGGHCLLPRHLQLPTTNELENTDADHIVDTAILELMEFWLMEPSLMQKMIYVLLPRYFHYNRAYTSLFRLIRPHHSDDRVFCQEHGVLELHGNPWPPIGRPHLLAKGAKVTEPYKSSYLINLLVSGAKLAFKPTHSVDSQDSQDLHTSNRKLVTGN